MFKEKGFRVLRFLSIAFTGESCSVAKTLDRTSVLKAVYQDKTSILFSVCPWPCYYCYCPFLGMASVSWWIENLQWAVVDFRVTSWWWIQLSLLCVFCRIVLIPGIMENLFSASWKLLLTLIKLSDLEFELMMFSDPSNSFTAHVCRALL